MTSLLAAFAAGLLTAASPCILPMAPILVGGLLSSDDASRWTRIRATSWFALGFAVVFAILGLGVAIVTRIVTPLRPLLLAVAAVTIGLHGLRMTGLIAAGGRFAWLHRSAGPAERRWSGSDRPRALLLGAIFGLTWTPCAGPILGAVLTWVAAGDTHAVAGVPMLLAYAGGVATPLLLVAAASEWVTPRLRRLGPHLETIERATGAMLVLLAVVVLARIPLAMPAPEPAGGSRVERLVFFQSEHCPTCRAMATFLPTLARACGLDAGTLGMVDVDRPESAPALAGANVLAVPTVSLRDAGGHEVVRLVGYQSPARLRDVLEHEGGMSCAPSDPETPSDPGVVDGTACDVGGHC